jgi:YggT family protein
MNVFSALIVVIQMLTTFFVWIIIISSILSFLLPPYHPVREAFGRILNPMLDPIRRLIPPQAGLDFSPLILFLIVKAVSFLLVNFLSSML